MKHLAVADAVLKSTVFEWTTPTGIHGFPHGIEVDSDCGIAWFSEIGNRGWIRLSARYFLHPPPMPGCGPACPVVWQGRAGDCSPYADFVHGGTNQDD